MYYTSISSGKTIILSCFSERGVHRILAMLFRGLSRHISLPESNGKNWKQWEKSHQIAYINLFAKKCYYSFLSPSQSCDFFAESITRRDTRHRTDSRKKAQRYLKSINKQTQIYILHSLDNRKQSVSKFNQSNSIFSALRMCLVVIALVSIGQIIVNNAVSNNSSHLFINVFMLHVIHEFLMNSCMVIVK